VSAACEAPEDPERVELRARLKRQEQLSPRELDRLLDWISRMLTEKTVRVRHDGRIDPLTTEQEEVVLGMLVGRAGIFDEAIRNEDGTWVRVINAPGRSVDPEYEATRRLLIDVETLLPRRFEFNYGVPGMEGYALDLVVD
jgi:hypothetical protein